MAKGTGFWRAVRRGQYSASRSWCWSLRLNLFSVIALGTRAKGSTLIPAAMIRR
jgi:hypothetical protein